MAVPKALEDLAKVVEQTIRSLGQKTDDKQAEASDDTSKHLRELADKLNKAASDVAGDL